MRIDRKYIGPYTLIQPNTTLETRYRSESGLSHQVPALIAELSLRDDGMAKVNAGLPKSKALALKLVNTVKKKGLSFISNRQRRKEGTFSASGL
jgi:hypothetical protein